ncbi:MAG: methyltransferase domain-containing protein [Nitriliruptorales bacterium]|nr:methyltransferase domain-containing protein [Nitriliruptorales bacterium]
MTITATHEALAAAAALRTAARLGVADRLRTTPMDARGLAGECGLSERGSRTLLAALVALDLAEPTAAGRFRATPGAELLTHAVALYDGLGDAVRTGQPALAWTSGRVAGEMYPRVVPMLAELFGPAAERAADILAGSAEHVLDVAAGAAPWSLAITARDPEATVTAVDVPEVITETRRAVTERGLEDRYRFVAGDAFTSDLGGPYHLAVVGNFCHLFGWTANLKLLRRLREVLVPGGRVAIIDVMPSAVDDPSPQLALYELSLLLRTTDGAAHPFSAYVDWLTQCGYRGIQRVDLDHATPMALVLATLD